MFFDLEWMILCVIFFTSAFVAMQAVTLPSV